MLAVWGVPESNNWNACFAGFLPSPYSAGKEKEMYQKKPLEELNVLDNFLISAIAADKEVEVEELGEAGRNGAETVVNVYDIEPHIKDDVHLFLHRRREGRESGDQGDVKLSA